MVGSLHGVMPRTVVLAFLAAAVALAAVLPTESGDVFYFASGGQAGAVNAFGQRLWSVPGQLIASDAMGSCLAVASALYNGTAFLGTAVTLYTPDGRPLWSAVVGVNATALATNCVETAVGGIDGSLYVLKDGKVASRQTTAPSSRWRTRSTERFWWAPATRLVASRHMWTGVATRLRPSRPMRLTS